MNATEEHTLEPMLERVVLARLLAQARADLAVYRAANARLVADNQRLTTEKQRLDDQIKQWSKANLAVVARLTKTERLLREVREQQGIERGIA